MALILLIEPDRQLSSLYEHALTHQNHVVHCVRTIDAAVSALDAVNFDTIILEIQLAQHNGIELLYEMRSYIDWNHIKIIIHSFIPEGKIMISQTVPHLRIDAYVYKPKTSLTDLCRTVAKVCEQQAA